MSLHSTTKGWVSLLVEDEEFISLTTSEESTFTTRLWMLSCFAMRSPSRKAHSSAIKTVVVPTGFKNRWTQFPFESRSKPPALAWLLMMEASVFSLCQPEGGLDHLAMSRGLALMGLFEAIRKWNSRAFATHSFSSFYFGCLAWKVTQFLLVQMNQRPKRNRVGQGMPWCQETSIEVQLTCIKSKKGRPKEVYSPEGRPS